MVTAVVTVMVTAMVAEDQVSMKKGRRDNEAAMPKKILLRQIAEIRKKSREMDHYFEGK